MTSREKERGMDWILAGWIDLDWIFNCDFCDLDLKGCTFQISTAAEVHLMMMNRFEKVVFVSVFDSIIRDLKIEHES